MPLTSIIMKLDPKNKYQKTKAIRLKGYKYKQLQRAVLKRDGCTCQNPKCKVHTQNAPHHIVYRSQGGSDSLQNMITLCGPLENDCHRKVHNHEITLDIIKNI